MGKSNLETRMTNLEKIVEAHLIESGAIRTDLVWVKKAVWTLAGAVLSYAGITGVAILSYLLKK